MRYSKGGILFSRSNRGTMSVRFAILSYALGDFVQVQFITDKAFIDTRTITERRTPIVETNTQKSSLTPVLDLPGFVLIGLPATESSIPSSSRWLDTNIRQRRAVQCSLDGAERVRGARFLSAL